MVKDTGNKVSRRATISGPQNIILGGKTIISNGAIIRGDLKRAGPGHAVVISLGRYCLVGEGCVMRCVSTRLPWSTLQPSRSSDARRDSSSRPPYKTYRGAFNYYPMKVGDFVHIGANTIVEAATIGNHVEIGKNCVIVRNFLQPIWFRLESHKFSIQGKFTIIKDCAKIADNTIIPPNTVIPGLTLFAGSPGSHNRAIEGGRSHVFSI